MEGVISSDERETSDKESVFVTMSFLHHVARSTRRATTMPTATRYLSSVGGPKPLAHKHGDLPPATTFQPSWATINPATMGPAEPAVLYNMVGGDWASARESLDIVDPMTGEVMLKMPDTQVDELQPFIDAAASCPKTGLHNPFKNKERCVHGRLFLSLSLFFLLKPPARQCWPPEGAEGRS